MGILVFSLLSESDAFQADRELVRNGVRPGHIRLLDRFSYLPAANDADITCVETAMPPELEREIAEGRVLLEVTMDEENPRVIEKTFAAIDGVRRFIAPGS